MGRYLPASKEAAAAAAGACAERGVAQVVGLINTLGATFQLSPAATGAAEDDAPSTPRPRAEAEGGAHAASPPAVLFRKVLADGEDPTAPGAADWLGGSTIAQEVGPARHRCAPRRAALALAERACTHTHTHTHTHTRARARAGGRAASAPSRSERQVCDASARPRGSKLPAPAPPKTQTQTQNPNTNPSARGTRAARGVGLECESSGGLGRSAVGTGSGGRYGGRVVGRCSTWTCRATRSQRTAAYEPRRWSHCRSAASAGEAVGQPGWEQERRGGGAGAQRVNTAIPLFTLFTCSLTLSPAFLSSLALSPSPQPSLTFALTLLRSGLRAPRIGHGCARAPRTLHPVPASRLAQLAG